ncbi:MAG: endolytic transglycosylase MltG [Spirochaetia bacterium]|nr:endolytic transglycosylase MltG [Spirochaetia bacterium]
MSTSSDNRNNSQKGKSAVPAKKRVVKKTPAQPAQNELFDKKEYAAKKYTDDDAGSEMNTDQDNRGSLLEPSSRATKLLARKAAEEAMVFSNRTKILKPEKTADISPPESEKAVKPQSKKRPPIKKKVKLSVKKMKQRRERIKFGIISAALIIIAVIIIILVLRQGGSLKNEVADTPYGPVPFIEADTPFDNEVRIFIESGMRAGDICRLLDTAGVVTSASRLQSYLVANKLDTKIRSGAIFLPKDMSVSDAAAALTRGYWEHPILSIYPGYTLEQIDSYLAGIGLAEKGEFILAAEQIARDNDLPFSEGFYYPDEYILYQLDNAAEVLAVQMYDRLNMITGPMMEQLALQGRTLSDAVIVASMIQRETGNPDEMPLIAGIIWKRLEEGIPLGIDATTRYELNDWINPISKAALENPTPYNTRRKRGLPPTGISNPGFDALQAAAYPEKSSYYYYLHDRSAQIHFAVTYEEHLKNVQTYLR